MAGTWQESAASRADEEEARVKYAALDSFSKYRRITHYNVTHRRRQNFYALSQTHWQLLGAAPINYQEKLNRVDDAISVNGKLTDSIVAHSIEAFGISEESDWKNTSKPNDHDKARSTIRQFYRDWSAEGAVERRACYDPVLADLETLFPNKMERSSIQALVPGAGLGRLLVELVAAGFKVEGNELSFHQMMASNFVLNGLKQEEKFELFPWALSFSNQASADKQLRSVSVPDVHPADYLNEASQGLPTHAFERMSMSAGDFCLLYATPEYHATFDVVTSVYFIDTAPNLIRYIEAIRNALKENGYWINLGPLLWHFEDRGPKAQGADDHEEENSEIGEKIDSKGIADPGSVELTAEEVLCLISASGFEILKHEIQEETQGYIQDTESMMGTSYRVLHFVARRKQDQTGSQ